jgi:lipopolysaccharide heptosyltransferase II
VSHGIVHAVDRYLDLARQLGVVPDKTVAFPLPERSEERDWVERLWQREGIRARETVCVLHPAARWETKRWPAERFAGLADRLIAEKELRVVLVGGRDQLRQVADVERQMKKRALNLGGSTTLLQLAALLRRANLLITNDSGPMHLAAAVGTLVVAVFGPTDPRRVGPYGDGHIALRKNIDCSHCNRRRCVRDALCMRAIEVDEVLDAVRKITRLGLLREKTTSTWPAEL